MWKNNQQIGQIVAACSRIMAIPKDFHFVFDKYDGQSDTLQNSEMIISVKIWLLIQLSSKIVQKGKKQYCCKWYFSERCYENSNNKYFR